jgi:hypothetical protein
MSCCCHFHWGLNRLDYFSFPTYGARERTVGSYSMDQARCLLIPGPIPPGPPGAGWRQAAGLQRSRGGLIHSLLGGLGETPIPWLPAILGMFPCENNLAVPIPKLHWGW